MNIFFYKMSLVLIDGGNNSLFKPLKCVDVYLNRFFGVDKELDDVGVTPN